MGMNLFYHLTFFLIYDIFKLDSLVILIEDLKNVFDIFYCFFYYYDFFS